ncbi:MAG: serine hydrolase [Rhodospirillaceae bacterium]|nr:serine hydrolase [Rhodospirillaceae bacterium]
MRPGSAILGLVLSLCILAISQVFAAEEAHARYASIVIDADTGEVLRSRSADVRRYPASLTKMMTLYLLFEAIDDGGFSLDSKLKVSKRAAGQSPSKLGLRAGSTIRAEDAIKSLIVKSANDIAVVVAEALGGTEVEFARMMTRKAKELGMSRTTFRNASGLPNRKQRSTARDMAQLARALMRDFPDRYHYFDDQRFSYKGRVHRTPNKLLGRYRGMDGIKTGYIRASGFNLVASAERDGRRVIAVVFGGKTPRSRNAHMANLLDLGFTRIAENDAKRGRVRYAGVPRPPAGSGLAAPALRFKPAVIMVAAAQPPDLVEGAAAPPAEPIEPPAPRPVPEPAEVVSGPLPPPSKSVAETLAVVGSVIATEPSPATTFPAASSVEGAWGIQVGAYESVTAAEIAMRRASARAPLLNDATATLMPRSDGRSTLYRARFLGLYKNDANRACKKLRAAPMPCTVIRGLDPASDPALSARS